MTRRFEALAFGLVALCLVGGAASDYRKGWAAEKAKKFNGRCWADSEDESLLGVMRRVIQIPLERSYIENNYIQTFGCAYEGDDIEQNSVRAVYRAIDQSLRNRRIAARDNVLGLLRSRPPRPDNLTREYTLYVNLAKDTEVYQARYEVRILDLKVVSTFESRRAVWTRVITRYAYQEDFKNAPPVVDEPSEFIEVMALAGEILKQASKGKFEKVYKLIAQQSKPTFHPTEIEELVFGDYLSLFAENQPLSREMPAIYLGKGIYIADLPHRGSTVLKFGEEQLFGLRLDAGLFRRATSLFVNLQYQPPESVLQCLLRRYTHEKPVALTGTNLNDD